MMKVLGIAWTVWKITTKRFGPAVGLVVAAAVVAGYLVVDRLVNEE